MNQTKVHIPISSGIVLVVEAHVSATKLDGIKETFSLHCRSFEVEIREIEQDG
jgi:hypothetical protein